MNRYYDSLEMMLGFAIGPYMKACWLVLTPSVTMVNITRHTLAMIVRSMYGMRRDSGRCSHYHTRRVCSTLTT